MQHDGSAYLSTKKAIQEAEDRGFDAGRVVGHGEGAEEMRAACIAYLESAGHSLGAQRLREAKMINGEAANG